MHFEGLEDYRKDSTAPHTIPQVPTGWPPTVRSTICTFHLGFSLGVTCFVPPHFRDSVLGSRPVRSFHSESPLNSPDSSHLVNSSPNVWARASTEELSAEAWVNIPLKIREVMIFLVDKQPLFDLPNGAYGRIRQRKRLGVLPSSGVSTPRLQANKTVDTVIARFLKTFFSWKAMLSKSSNFDTLATVFR